MSEEQAVYTARLLIGDVANWQQIPSERAADTADAIGGVQNIAQLPTNDAQIRELTPLAEEDSEAARLQLSRRRDNVPWRHHREAESPMGDWPAGLYPAYWQRAMTGLESLRSEIEALDHRLISVRLLPAVEAALDEARRYRAACLEEAGE